MASTKKPATRLLPKKTAARTVTKRATKTVATKTPTKKVVGKKTSNKTSKTTQPAANFEDHLTKLAAVSHSSAPSTTRVSAPAVLSPYRFPIAIDTLLTQTARLSGMALVVFGALFSLFHLSTLPQTIAAIESVSNVAQTSGATTTVTNTTPSAQFGLPANPLSGTVTVTISVDLAQTVKVMAYSQADGQTITLGSATQQSATLWSFDWDTTKNLDGTYNLSALIKNQYGTYTEQSWLPLDVYNPPSTSTTGTTVATTTSSGTATQTTTTTTTGTTNAANTTTTTTTNTAATQNSSILKLTQDDTKHTVAVAVSGSNINKVFVFLSQVGGVPTGVGTAYDFGTGVFKYTHDTFGMAAGDYEITVKVTYLDRQVVTKGPQTFTIKSSTTTSATSTGAATAQTTSLTATTQPVTTNLQPTATLYIANATALQGVVDLAISVDHATAVELYAVSKQSLTTQYIGTARQLAASNWVLRFDTTAKPNGDYGLYASIRNAYGAYQSAKFPITIKNPIKTTATTDTTITTLQSVNTAVTVPKTSTETTTAVASTDSVLTAEAKELTTTSDETEARLREEFGQIFARLATALRLGDEAALTVITEQLSNLRTRVITELSGTAERDFLTDIDEAQKRAQAEVDRTNKLVAERTALAATTDTDKDGISDFDEVTLYRTDPKLADTDGDGFPDGAEILRGFDPLDAVAETVVAYESPKESGIVREDIVAVEDVVVSPKSDQKPISETFITGRALPNSFVTLYIFSTPVVVTVRTETDGSWVYRFDKELEDGEHEVYAGITDNAGRIVAKSNPLKFVKEAEAFTPVDATAEGVISTNDTSSIITEKIVLIVLSVSVLAIGVVLIMLGMHMDAVRRKYALAQGAKVTV